MSPIRPAVPSILLGTAVGLVMLAPPALAYNSTSRAQPGYTSSTLTMKVKNKPRAGGLVVLDVAGSNLLFPDPPDPDFPDRTPLDYTLDVFVHDRALGPNCEPNYQEQNNRIINFPTRVRNIGAFSIGPSGPFRKTVRFRAGSARKITLCAYVRYSATDDIILSSLKHDLLKRKKTLR